MPDNTHRFTGRAEDYDRYRQRYPTEEVLSRLRAWCDLQPAWLVADAGAGTGMVADIFLSNGNRVIAIEPNLDMLDHMRATYAPPHPHASQLQLIQATAEETTLPNSSVNLIAIGRAFHWFDRETAIAEFRRILKPGGWIVFVAADRDHESRDPGFARQLEEFEGVLTRWGRDYTRVRSGYRSYEDLESFLVRDFRQERIPGTRQMDWDTFRGHTQSLSVAPLPGHEDHAEFIRDLRRHFELYARDGVLTVPTTCWITVGRFAPVT